MLFRSIRIAGGGAGRYNGRGDENVEGKTGFGETGLISDLQFAALLPLACEWAAEQERFILREGVGLTAEEAAEARTLGVACPERVRLLSVRQIPIPEHPVLRASAEATGLISPLTAGLTVRYGIFVREDCWGERQLVLHELVHTSQYERLGGFEAFLGRYLSECLTFGYPAAPMEQEAILKSAIKRKL